MSTDIVAQLDSDRSECCAIQPVCRGPRLARVYADDSGGAVDLAGRLSGVILRARPSRELDDYERVRRPAGLRALQHTRAQAALGAERNDELRQIISKLVTNRRASRQLAQLIESA